MLVQTKFLHLIDNRTPLGLICPAPRCRTETPNEFVSGKSNWCSITIQRNPVLVQTSLILLGRSSNLFVPEGFVFLDISSNQAPIRILRDTGATQSLLLEVVLPVIVSTSTGESGIAQGIEGGCMNIPSHKVFLVSDLGTGSVVGGIRPTLPI